MKPALFYWILNMSLVGSLAGLIVLVVRKLPRMPKGLCYGLWAIPALRFLCPVGISSPYSFLYHLGAIEVRVVPLPLGAGQLDSSMANCIGAAGSYFPLVLRTNRLEAVFTAAFWIWILVACAGALLGIFLYGRTKKSALRVAICRDGVMFSPDLRAAGVYGILRPRILVPEGTEEADLPYILAHERVHIRRWDNLWRCLGLGICCIHWFNPLVWMFLRFFFADMELSCDSRVLKSLEPEQRRAYAMAIVRSAAGSDWFPASFGGAKTRTRIQAAVSYRNLTLVSLLFFLALALAVAVVLGTNPIA